jgi:FkbM family methyltransferase
MLERIKAKLKAYFIENGSIPDFKKSMHRLKELGFKPGLVFDIGAYKGDFARLCLELWNNTNVVCFEPLEAQYKILEQWSKTEKRIKVIHGLLGDEDKDQVKFNENETASSVLDETISKNFKTGYHKMRTLDTSLREFNLNVPNLLKIDTQGFEYQILKGFSTNLDQVEVIIAELNHIDIHDNVKLAEEVIGLLYAHGFVIYDIVEIHRRPFDNAIWQTDFMFVKKDSFLRRNKQWK